MRIVVPVVVEMTDQQVADWAADAGISTRAKDIVGDVRGVVVSVTAGAFDNIGSGADVSLKER